MGFVVGVQETSLTDLVRFCPTAGFRCWLIPIVFLPYEHLIDWNKHAIIVNENDDIANVIIEFHKNTNEETLINMQKQNRKLWEEYFTPLSFIKHIGDFCNGNR